MDKDNIEKVFQLITQRIKTGFVFDVAPEVNHSCCCLLKKDEKLSFKGNRNSPTGLGNNDLDVFRIEYTELDIEDYNKAEELTKQAQKVFKELDPNYEDKDEFDIYNKLSSLKPLVKEDEEKEEDK